MREIKKILSIVIIFVICFSNTASLFVLAQEESPTPEPTPFETVIDNNAEITDNIVIDSNTGENIIETTSPSPEPPVEPVIEPTTEPTETPISEIITSDSVSVVEVENNVNSNIVNSEFIYHTLNIFLPTEGNIDLSTLAFNVLNKVYGEDNNLNEEINVKVTTVDNFAYVENNISSTANTGSNELVTGGDSSITTGDSYSAVSVLNNVNTNIIDSKIHLVTINIFGNLEGNIILPETQNSNSGCSNCGGSVVLDNNAVVSNNVNSSATTGGNNITTVAGSGNIETGSASSVVNVLNLVNTNFINVVFKYFYINTLGVWIGDFLGWMDESATTDDNVAISSSLNNGTSSDGCTDCSSDAVGGHNFAFVSNNINSTANTGSNKVTSNGNSNIITGNAYSSVSLVNFVNSNLINSSGFIGFINIFGSLVGDVGGTSLFEEEIVEEPKVLESNIEQNNQQEVRESGGIIEVTHTNNVGTHVLPGDTVTFFAKVKNTGVGKIYDANLTIELFKDGISYGGSIFKLGEINSQKALKLTTGLVLSKKAVSGKYTAVVTATGIVGPDNHEVSSVSYSEFKILGFNTVLANQPIQPVNAFEENQPQILGTSQEATDPMAQKLIVIFSSLLLLYLILKGIQKREFLISYAYRIGSLLT